MSSSSRLIYSNSSATDSSLLTVDYINVLRCWVVSSYKVYLESIIKLLTSIHIYCFLALLSLCVLLIRHARATITQLLHVITI
jgi:hypothetical protein